MRPVLSVLCRKKYLDTALGPKKEIKDGALFMVLNKR